MNNFAEIVRVGIIIGLGMVLMIMALLIANGNSFLTKGMNKKYTNESVEIIVRIIVWDKLFFL